MTGGDETLVIAIDGVEVEVSRLDGNRFRLVSNEREIGSLELVPGGTGFIARRVNGDNLKRPSPWGGEVTARFQTRELAVRALLASG